MFKRKKKVEIVDYIFSGYNKEEHTRESIENIIDSVHTVCGFISQFYYTLYDTSCGKYGDEEFEMLTKHFYPFNETRWENGESIVVKESFLLKLESVSEVCCLTQLPFFNRNNMIEYVFSKLSDEYKEKFKSLPTFDCFLYLKNTVN